MTVALARDFINRVRRALVEKGIPLDQGYRDFARVCNVRMEKKPDNSGTEEQSATEPEQIFDMSHNSGSISRSESVYVVGRDDRNTRSVGRARRYKGGWGTRTRSQRPACFICGNTEHFQRACPHQHCQACGKKGHDRRDCYSKGQVFSLNHDSGNRGNWRSEAGMMVSLDLNGTQTAIMLDSGAQPSIIDTYSLGELHMDYQARPGKVHGVCATPINTKGFVELEVDIGSGYPMKHRFVVLDSRERTVILGRDFLRRFRSTEFDWNNHRVRLGQHWLSTEISS